MQNKKLPSHKGRKLIFRGSTQINPLGFSFRLLTPPHGETYSISASRLKRGNDKVSTPASTDRRLSIEEFLSRHVFLFAFTLPTIEETGAFVKREMEIFSYFVYHFVHHLCCGYAPCAVRYGL